jgi:transposase
MQLVAVEEAFKNLKGDLAIRPIFHQEERRIEAHIFIAFLACCLYITLHRRLYALAPGLTARSALEKFAAVQSPSGKWDQAVKVRTKRMMEAKRIMLSET